MSSLPETRAELAQRIDHTLLKPEASREQIERLCAECRRYGFAAACVNPVWVGYCAEALAGSATAVASVAGFPLGASATDVKAFEARTAVRDGAREIDMVANLGALVAGDGEAVQRDIAAVVSAAKGLDGRAVGRADRARLPVCRRGGSGLRQDLDGLPSRGRGDSGARGIPASARRSAAGEGRRRHP
jgi:hypothetical protein